MYVSCAPTGHDRSHTKFIHATQVSGAIMQY
eukprot:SAG11_NODE_1283_length_5306_cov_3.174957_1_plen_30_part_10